MKININKLLPLFIISSLLCNDNILWDMGMVIKENQIDHKQLINQNLNTNSIQKDALRTSPFVAPTKHSVILNKTNLTIFEPTINTKNKNRIFKKLNENYLKNNYKNIIRMIDNSNLNNLNINEQNNFKYLLADAYFNVGDYNNAKKIIAETLKKYPEDRFYILYGMIFESIGDYNNAKKQFKKILIDYKTSEYYLTAKIKCQVLSHN